MNAIMKPNMPKYSIDTCALIVEFSASVWTARKLDKTTTEEVVSDKHAGNKGAARVNKHLLAGRTELEVITQCVNRARVYIYSSTLPWSDNGDRLLPSSKFMAFNAKMQVFEQEFWSLVKDFKTVYPTLMTAQAMALGDMYNRNDFPSVGELDHKFAFSFGYLPVPAQGDFRIDVGNDAQKELQEQLERMSSKRLDAAMDDVRTRLREHLERMSDRLVVDRVGGEEKKRKFHDTLIDGALELCDLVKDLNLTGDPKLEQARSSLEQALIGVTPTEVRKNDAVRDGLKKEVDAILAGYTF
jgi:hypothetical protein